jgi:beta-phosphoglucomutase
MKKFAVIFDMDGVLIDSNKIVWDSFNKLLEPFGIHISDEEIKQRLGSSLRDNIDLWNKKYNLNLNLEEFSRKSFEIQLKALEKVKTDKNLINLLEDLKLNKILMSVGTSSKKSRTEEILNLLKIRDYFSAIVTANDVDKHKPDPSLFLEAAKRLGINPDQCVVIEDAQSGISAAKNGNMKAIGYLTKENSKDELKNADLIINNFKELNLKKLGSLF